MKLFVVSNMYPDEKHPAYGSFVKQFCGQLESLGVEYTLGVMHQCDSRWKKAFSYLRFYVCTTLRLVFSSQDAVYVHYASHSSLPVLAACCLRRLRVITNVHGSDVVPENPRQQKMQRFTAAILKRSWRIVVPSEYFRCLTAERYGLDPEKIFVYPSGGVDPAVFSPCSAAESRNVIPALAERDGTRPLLGMVGRISEGKGWDTFVDAAALLRVRGLQADWLLVGDGPQSGQLQQRLEDKGMSGTVLRAGMLPQEKLAAVYSALDYFVFPTRRAGESLGLVALEAMACGTPVISADFAAPHYYVVNGENGFKFKPGDAAALADAVELAVQAMQDAPAYAALQRGARETAAGYAPEAIRCQLKEVLDLQE